MFERSLVLYGVDSFSIVNSVRMLKINIDRGNLEFDENQDITVYEADGGLSFLITSTCEKDNANDKYVSNVMTGIINMVTKGGEDCKGISYIDNTSTDDRKKEFLRIVDVVDRDMLYSFIAKPELVSEAILNEYLHLPEETPVVDTVESKTTEPPKEEEEDINSLLDSIETESEPVTEETTPESVEEPVTPVPTEEPETVTTTVTVTQEVPVAEEKNAYVPNKIEAATLEFFRLLEEDTTAEDFFGGMAVAYRLKDGKTILNRVKRLVSIFATVTEKHAILGSEMISRIRGLDKEFGQLSTFLEMLMNDGGDTSEDKEEPVLEKEPIIEEPEVEETPTEESEAKESPKEDPIVAAVVEAPTIASESAIPEVPLTGDALFQQIVMESKNDIELWEKMIARKGDIPREYLIEGVNYNLYEKTKHGHELLNDLATTMIRQVSI